MDVLTAIDDLIAGKPVFQVCESLFDDLTTFSPVGLAKLLATKYAETKISKAVQKRGHAAGLKSGLKVAVPTILGATATAALLQKSRHEKELAREADKLQQLAALNHQLYAHRETVKEAVSDYIPFMSDYNDAKNKAKQKVWWTGLHLPGIVLAGLAFKHHRNMNRASEAQMKALKRMSKLHVQNQLQEPEVQEMISPQVGIFRRDPTKTTKPYEHVPLKRPTPPNALTKKVTVLPPSGQRPPTNA